MTGRSARTRRLTALALIGLLTLTACAEAPGGSGEPPLPEEWTAFGPFEKSAAYAAEHELPGPGSIRLPDGGTVRLDAAELLGTGVKLLDRDGYRITAESYLYTMNGEDPIIVGLVQATHEMHYRGYTENEHVTFVLGISAEAEPREIARTRILRGAEHDASFAGRSDQGVVAVLLQGTLNTDALDDSRVVGVDAVRGTEVWVKEHGFPAYGEETARFFVSPTPDSCASAIVSYDVASGTVLSQEEFENSDPAVGVDCKTATAATS